MADWVTDNAGWPIAGRMLPAIGQHLWSCTIPSKCRRDESPREMGLPCANPPAPPYLRQAHVPGPFCVSKTRGIVQPMEKFQARLIVCPLRLKASAAPALGVDEPDRAAQADARAITTWTWWVGSATEADATHTARLGLSRAVIHTLQAAGCDILLVFDLEASDRARRSLCRAARELFMLFSGAAHTPRVTLLALNVDVAAHMRNEGPLPLPEAGGDTPRTAAPSTQLAWIEALWRSPSTRTHFKTIRVAPCAESNSVAAAETDEEPYTPSLGARIERRLNRLAAWSSPAVYVSLAQSQALTLAARLWADAPAGTYHLCADPPKPWSVVEHTLRQSLGDSALKRAETRYRAHEAPSTAQTRGALARLGLRLPHATLPKLSGA